jgi:hypothetical protein
MAIIHQATINPTKPELLATLLGGAVEIVGSYRFDDPAGAVGVEGFVVQRDDALSHVLFTYRGAPLDSEDARLVSTMEHSALGGRWVYDGTTDPVAVDCFRRALLGEQEQATLEVWGEEGLVKTLEPSIRLSVRQGTGSAADDASVRFVRDLGTSEGDVDGPALVATWADGEAVIAELV